MLQIKEIIALAVMGVTAVAGSTKASTVTITPTVVAYYTPADEGDVGGASDPIPTPVNGNTYLGRGSYVIALNLATTLSTADQAAGDTGFGNVGFDATIGGSVVDDSGVPGYIPIYPTISTTNGNVKYVDPLFGITKGSGLASTALWADNHDAGISSTDGKFLLVDVGELTPFGANDPRLHVTTSGQGTTATNVLGLPDILGYYVVDFYTGNNGYFTVSEGTAGEGFSLHNNTTTTDTFVQAYGTPNPDETFTGGQLFFTTPEPASISFLGLGTVGLIRGRRQARAVRLCSIAQ